MITSTDHSYPSSGAALSAQLFHATRPGVEPGAWYVRELGREGALYIVERSAGGTVMVRAGA